MNIKYLQENLPWGAHTYSPAFLAGVSHNHFGHALLHITKAAGKLAGLVDDLDHGAEFIDSTAVGKYLADVVICAIRMANMMPGGAIDLEQAIIDRLRDKFAGMLLVRASRVDGIASGETQEEWSERMDRQAGLVGG